MLEILSVIAFVAAALILSSIKIVRDDERLVVFRFGQMIGERGPGFQIVWPFIEKYQKVDLRVMNEAMPETFLVTRDQVPVNVKVICFFKVFDAEKTVAHADDVREATKQVVQSALSQVLSDSEFSQWSQNSNRINSKLKAVIDAKTAAWGVKVTDCSLNLERSTDQARGAILLPGELQMAGLGHPDEIVSTPHGEHHFAGVLGSAAHKFVADHVEPTAHEWEQNHHHYTFGHHTYDFGHDQYKFGHESEERETHSEPELTAEM